MHLSHEDEDTVRSLHRALSQALGRDYDIGPDPRRGATAYVFRAKRAPYGRDLAIKVYDPQLFDVRTIKDRLDEIRILSLINQHPHIVTLLDSGWSDDIVWLVMPFIDGQSLAERLNREGALEPDHAIALAVEVADALHHAHDKGIFHRDVKPANILLSGKHAFLSDFGSSAIMAPTAANAEPHPGGGTAHYLCPEGFFGDAAPSAHADVYALGVTLYEMLTGEIPLGGETWERTAARRQTEEPPSVLARRPGLPPDLDTILRRAMAREPEDRFTGALEFGRALVNVSARFASGRAPSITIEAPVNRVIVAEFMTLSDDLREVAALLTDATREVVGTADGLQLVEERPSGPAQDDLVVRVAGRVHAFDAKVRVHALIWPPSTSARPLVRRWIESRAAIMGRVDQIAEEISVSLRGVLNPARAIGEVRGHAAEVVQPGLAGRVDRGRRPTYERLAELLNQAELDDVTPAATQGLLRELESDAGESRTAAEEAVRLRAILRVLGDPSGVLASTDAAVAPWRAWALAAAGRASHATALAADWLLSGTGDVAAWRTVADALWLARDYASAHTAAVAALDSALRDPVILAIGLESAARLGTLPAEAIMEAIRGSGAAHPRLRSAMIAAKQAFSATERTALEAMRVVPHGQIAPAYAAALAVHTGNKEEALELLSIAQRRGSPSLVALNVDPRWDALRPDVRFQRLARTALSIGLGR